MTGSVVFWLGMAVLLFWSLGAYNRLVRLRAQVRGMFAQVDQPMVQTLALLGEAAGVPDATSAVDDTALPDTSGVPVHYGLQAAAIQLEVALRVVRKHALDASAVAALQTAYATTHDVWDRRQGTLPDAVSADEVVMQRAWEDNTHVVRVAVGGFNAAVQAYNAAIAQFPASILAYLFSFSQAAQL